MVAAGPLVAFTSPTVPNTSGLSLIARAYVRIGEAASMTEHAGDVNDEIMTNRVTPGQGPSAKVIAG